MEIEDLYINSDRLIANIDLTHKRYLYYTINWNHRMIWILSRNANRIYRLIHVTNRQLACRLVSSLRFL